MAYDPSALLTSLLARQQQIITELSAMVGGTAPALPNSQGAGSTDWVGYRKSLRDEFKENQELIATLQGPYEITQQGMT